MLYYGGFVVVVDPRVECEMQKCFGGGGEKNEKRGKKDGL
jgi:hypothetical protein